VNRDLELLYDIYTRDFISLVEREEFYEHFINMAKSGKSEMSFMHRFVDKQIDVRWIEAIEACIIPLDTIIRNPRRFISQEEEIIPIELARKITTDSIKHLAQHTNMIAKVENDSVTPNRILNIYKEESYETYENRFIYTLLLNIQYFIDKRLNEMKSGATGQNVSSIHFTDEFENGKEIIKYSFEMTTQSPAFKLSANADLDADVTKMGKFERVERIRKILFDFQNSPVMKALSGCALVRPPIMRTNVIAKNPDFKKAKELWDFIETYREVGFNIEVTEHNEIPNERYIEDLFNTLAINYSLIKHHTKTESTMDYDKRKRIITPKLVERTFKEILEDVTLDIDVVKNIFVNQVEHVSAKRAAKENKILAVLDQVLKTEAARVKAVEDEIAARIIAEKKAEEARRKAEKKALERQIAREKALAAKKKAEEKARREKLLQKEKEKARKERELQREKARIEKERLLERERILKMKEKARLDREKERERLKAEKELQLEREKARKEREKQREKARREKEIALEKERARKERERLREKQRREKELALEKERARKERERLREKQRREKELQLEREKARKLKEKERNKKNANKS